MLSDWIKDKLLAGDIDFIDRLDSYQLEVLFKNVGESFEREKILNVSFNLISYKYPMYAFMMTYDLEKYETFCKKYLNKNLSILLNSRFLILFLDKSKWAEKFVFEHLDELVLGSEDSIFIIVKYAIQNEKTDWINTLAFHNNLEIRARFMMELLEDRSYYLSTVYDDITKYFVKEYESGKRELIKEEYISKMATFVLINKLDINIYYKIRDFIFENYESNILASELDKNIYEDSCMEALISDIDKLFITSKNFKYELSVNYADYLSPLILNDFNEKILPFKLIDGNAISNVFIHSLGDKFLEYVEKYMKLSTGAKVISNAGVGSCSRVFRVGDFVIKCSNKKWSTEDEICPRSYLILKNYEEIFIRTERGNVVAGLEVQDYLYRPLEISATELIENIQNALLEEGLEFKDTLTGGLFGPNCFYLSSYLNADCDDLEALPEWFKKNPVVIVDRDLVYRKEKKL